MLFLSLYYTSPFIENSPDKYSDSALLEKTAKSFGNHAVNKRIFEKKVSTALRQVRLVEHNVGFPAQKVSLDLFERIRLIKPI